jgi:hypothetical protein
LFTFFLMLRAKKGPETNLRALSLLAVLLLVKLLIQINIASPGMKIICYLLEAYILNSELSQIFLNL